MFGSIHATCSRTSRAPTLAHLVRVAIVTLSTLSVASVLAPPGAAAQDESGGFLDLFGGTMRYDGSCVAPNDGDCLGLPDRAETTFKGLRAGYRSPTRWSVEVTLARDGIGENRAVFQAGAGSPPARDLGRVDVRLWTVGGTYSLLRRGPIDVYASAGIGRVTFDAGYEGHMEDFVTVVGGGALVHVWRILFVRGDVRGYTEWCSDDRDFIGLECDDGSTLGHLEATVGVQLVFHPYDLR